jgi:hypothetical protein
MFFSALAAYDAGKSNRWAGRRGAKRGGIGAFVALGGAVTSNNMVANEMIQKILSLTRSV